MTDIVERLRTGCGIGYDKAVDAAQRMEDAADEIVRLRTACEQMLIGGNHIATYRTDLWPPVGSNHGTALAALGAGKDYDMWCCWNAMMHARDMIAPPANTGGE